MSERVILAYSGGLDTSVAISWIGKETGREVVAVAIDLGQGGEDMEVVRQRALDCGAVEAVVVDARDEFADEYCLPDHPVQRALHGPLSAGLGDQPAADRQAPGRGGTRARRRHRRARLHRQGQRPGPLRGRIRLAGTGSRGARAGPRLRVDAGEGHRVRRGERHPDQRHQALAVLDRPERVGPRGGNRLPGAPLERPDQGRLRLHRGPDRQLEHPRRGHRRLRKGVPVSIDGQARHGAARPSSSSTAAPAPRASAGSTSSRTGSSASRAARSTRRRARWCSSPRTPSSSTSRWNANSAGSSAPPIRSWGELVYDGLWYSPLKRALETFVAKTQEHVTGEIRMVLHGGHIAVNGRRSAESLYDFNLATYDEGDTFDQSSAKGFVHVHGLSSKIAASETWRSDALRQSVASEHQRGLAVGRPVRRRAVGRPCRAEQVDPFRLGAGTLRRHGVEGARAGAVSRRAAHRGAARRTARRSGQPRRGRRRRQLRTDGHRRGRARRARTRADRPGRRRARRPAAGGPVAKRSGRHPVPDVAARRHARGRRRCARRGRGAGHPGGRASDRDHARQDASAVGAADSAGASSARARPSAAARRRPARRLRQARRGIAVRIGCARRVRRWASTPMRSPRNSASTPPPTTRSTPPRRATSPPRRRSCWR